jgi:gliding motility-associated-like protein
VSVTITVSSTADASIDPAGPFCSDDASVTLSAATPGGTWSGTGITNAVNGTFDPGVAGAGSFVIIYTISGSCGDADTLTIVVNASADANIDPAGPFCYADAPVNLTAQDPGGTWSGNGITNASLGTFDPATAGVGTHLITYGIAGPCGDTATLSITVDSVFDASILSSGPYCDNVATVSLVSTTAGGTWSGQGITNTSTGAFGPAAVGAGTYAIIYTISGTCGAADTVNISVVASPNATLTASDESCIGMADGTAAISASGGTSPYTYLWQNSQTSASISGLAPGSYSVILSDANGCFIVDTATILASTEPCEVIVPVIYVPNVFSPNGDGINDVLFVHGQGVATLEFKIFDRWGEVVFQTTDLNTGWDGTFRGKTMNNAVFVYLLDASFVNGETVSRTGNVSIVK